MEKELKNGDKWPYHYRGSKYHYTSDGEVYWYNPLKLIRVKCLSGHEEAVDLLKKIKPGGGSFRATENRKLITKLVEPLNGFDENEEYEPYYAGDLKNDMIFENVDINPKDIRFGDLWPGFYEGSLYHFNHKGKIWWRDSIGRRWFAKKDYPNLSEKLLRWKRLGGSFKINEYRHVISLLEKVPFPDYINEQMDALSDIQKSIIEYKVETTNLVPIYICDFDDVIELKDPTDIERKWTEKETEAFIEKLKKLGKY
ncbi:MAG: hypothetical protein ACFE95_07645 [Candidatus Hodarchaeota archaeon]